MFLIADVGLCGGVDLLAANNHWKGDRGFTISNQTITLVSNKIIAAYLDNMNFISGKTYKISVEFDWKGVPAGHPHDFFMDLFLKNVWDDSNFNFIPSNNLRRNGKHRYTAVFNCAGVPDPVSLRIIKLSPAEIKIHELKIETVSKLSLHLYSLSNKIRKNKIEICVGIWLVLQILFLFWIVKFKLITKTNSNLKQKKKSYGLLAVSIFILICLIAGSLKLRYDNILSKTVSLNLLKQKWRSVEMQDEGNNSKIVSISKAPTELNGSYWLDVAINLPVPSSKKDEEFIVDFFGENYDTADTKVHIPISDNKKHITRKALLYFDNPPSNLYVMVYSTYNSRVKLKKLTLKKKPALKEILLLQ